MSDTLTVSNINYRTISGSTITASTIMGSTLSISTLLGSTMNISTLTGSTITGNQITFSTMVGSTITSLTNNVTSIVYGDGSTQISSSPAMDDTTFGTNWSQNAAPLGTWKCIAGSSTGQYQIAASNQGIFLTRNYGQTWTQLTSTSVNGTTGAYPSGTTSASAWFDAAVSSSGKYMTIMTTGTGNLYVSSNYGITWVIAPSAATAANYQCASMSAAGLYQLATISGGQLQLSINSGTTWSAVATSKTWMCCGMSATGQYMTAVASTGGATAAGVFLSSNYGQTWTDLASYTLNSATGAYPAATTSNLDWSACAVSATGQYQIIARTVAPPYTTTLLLYTSSNYGITWTATASTAATSNTWNRMQVSASGQYQVATSVTPSVTTSLLNAYQFDLQDQSGTGVYNQVTCAYDGTLVNGATISSATSKYATGSLSLTGSASQYLQLPSFTMTAGYTGLTFSIWINLNTTQPSGAPRIFEFGQAPRLSSGYISGAGTAFYFYLLYASNVLQIGNFSVTNGSYPNNLYYTTPYTPSTGTWTHVAWVLTGSVWTLYLNGSAATLTLGGSTIPAFLPPTTYLSGLYAYNFIGRGVAATDPYTTGNFNDFRMYTTALSAAQVTTLYNATPNTLAYSTNFGANWSVASIRAADVAISTDGRNLSAACQGSFGIQQSAAAAPVTTITGTTVMNSTVAQGQADLGTLTPSAYATLGQTWNVIPSLPSAGWSSCAVSATGQYMSVIIQGTAVPSGYNIYYSTNYGATWTLATGFLANGTFNSINMSGNGQYQIATIYGTSSVFYKSSNYGATWTASSYNVGPWLRSCLSYTGQYQYITNAYTVSVSAGGVYYSADYGTTFTLVTPAATLTWVGICCSSTGQYVTAGSSTGAIYYSSNYGVSYTASALTGYATTLSCSASGQYQIVGIYGSYLYYSTTYGATWMQSNSPAATWYGSASSSSGQIMMACVVNAGGLIYYSLNYGASWALTNAGPASYFAMSMSQNGLYTLTVVSGGAVYLSTATPANISLLTNGRVGIGTTAPQATLDVYGSFRATSDLVAQGINLRPSPENATLIQQYFQKVASTAAPNGVPPFWSSGNGYTAIAAGTPATSAYNGSVLLPDGRVVFVPNFASSIGLFNPLTNTFSSILGMPGNYAYGGGVLLPDGRVVFVPANTTTIGLFNPMTSAYSTITGTPGGYAYVGGVLLPDGRVLFVPCGGSTIGFFNPATNTYSTITPTSPALPGGNAYQYGVLLPDGRVVFVPASAANIGIFNSTTNTFNTIPITAVASAYMGGVLLPDGRVLFVPYSATTLGIFNPTTSTFSTITGIAISNAYAGGVLLPDGRVALIPYSSATVGIFNPVTNTYSTIGITSPGAAFWGGTLLPDGRVVFAPFYSSNIGILTTSMSAPREMCLSPYCNKL